MSKKRDPFKEKLNYNAAIRLIQRVHGEIIGTSIRVRNYTHARVMKDKESLDFDLADMVHDTIVGAAIQLRTTERLLGRLMHDECRRRVAKSK